MTEQNKTGAPQGNKNALKHGGVSAMNAVREGREFTGIAAETQKAIQADYDERGPGMLIMTNSVRLQTCSELYYNAVMKAASDGNLAQMDLYLKVYIWLTNSANRAFETAHKLHKRDDGNQAETIIMTYRDKNTEEGGSDASDN